MKNNKGITLIALIMTIVVMLILLGVSVTTALKGKLINTTQGAADKTKLDQDMEQLKAAVILSIGNNGRVNFTKLETTLPEGFTKVKDSVYTSASGNKFRVFDNGDIIDGSIAYLDIAEGSIQIYSDKYKIKGTTTTEEQYKGPYIITGTTTSNTVSVMEEGTYDITIKNLTIDLSSSTSPISAFNANKGSKAQGCLVNITLEGNNSLCSVSMAGITFCGGNINTPVETNRSTLTIKGNGYLDAEDVRLRWFGNRWML